MNDIQCLIDRQLGFYSRLSYDNILKRLVVDSEESFYGLQSANPPASFDQDPPIFACRFSEAPGYEHILALANEDGRVAIQDTSTTKSASMLEGFQCHNNAVFDLVWMPHTMNFVTVSGDHTARLWDAGAGAGALRRVRVFAAHARSVKCAAARRGAPACFATGGRDGHVLVWDARAPPLPAIVLKPDNRLMNCHSGSAPKTPGSHGKRPRLDAHRATSVTGLVFQDDFALISCGECDGSVKVWDLRRNYDLCRREPLPRHSIPYCGSSTRNGYTNLIVDDSGTRLYASCVDNVIYCFNVSTYSSLPEMRYVGHENGTFYIKTCLSPDGAYLVSGSSDKNAYVWNVKCSEPVVKLTGHWAEVTCPAWCRARAAGTKLVTCSDDAKHKIWRIGREFPDPDVELKGRAEPVPRTDVTTLPKWGGPDKTPNSLKRKLSTPGSHGAKRLRTQPSTSGRKTKRCLVDLMNASRDTDEAETSIKRLRIDSTVDEEAKLLPAGTKRPGEAADQSPSKRCPTESADDWSYVPKAGSSYMTPTKNYENKNCKAISPNELKPLSPNTAHNRSPVKHCPSEVRMITFTTPTKNLPNYVLNGEAPHLSLMSPVRKKENTTDWLTAMVREKKGKSSDFIDKINLVAPSSPKENAPTRRNSVTDKTPKSVKKSRTLLKYFSVKVKDNK